MKNNRNNQMSKSLQDLMAKEKAHWGEIPLIAPVIWNIYSVIAWNNHNKAAFSYSFQRAYWQERSS